MSVPRDIPRRIDRDAICSVWTLSCSGTNNLDLAACAGEVKSCWTGLILG